MATALYILAGVAVGVIVCALLAALFLRGVFSGIWKK